MYRSIPNGLNHLKKGRYRIMTMENKRKLKTWKTIMFLMTFIFATALVNVGSISAQAKKKKVVVLYLSATGTTKGVAKRIKKITMGQMIEIKAADPYTEADVDWTDDKSRVTKEHGSADSPRISSVRPEISNLSTIKKAVKKADIVYIGYPIWWYTIPMVMETFFDTYDFSGVTIVPFNTHAGSRDGGTYETLKEREPNANVLDGLAVSGGSTGNEDTKTEIIDWVNGLNLN